MNKLTDESIAEWIASNERFELRGDGGGLYVSYRPEYNSPLWVFRFRQFGQQHKLTLGRYPAMSVDEARDLARGYRKLIESGEGVIAAVGNARAADDDANLARTFSAMLREASRNGAQRMTVMVEFSAGGTWQT